MLPNVLPKNLPREIDPDRITASVRIGASSRSFMGETVLAIYDGALIVLMRDSSFGPFIYIQPSKSPEYEDFGLDHVLWITDERGLRLEIQVSAGEMEEVREFLIELERADPSPPGVSATAPPGSPGPPADSRPATPAVSAGPSSEEAELLKSDAPAQEAPDTSGMVTEDVLVVAPASLPDARLETPEHQAIDAELDESDLPTETGAEIPDTPARGEQVGETGEGVASTAAKADARTAGEEAWDWRHTALGSTQQRYVNLGVHEPTMKTLLEEERWQDVSALLEKCAECAPAERESLADLDRCARLMADENLEGAFYWLADEVSSYSNEFTDLFLVRLSKIAARAGDQKMAAEFLCASITPEMKARADEIMARLGVDEEALREKRTEAACRYFRQRTVDNPDDAYAWSRAAAWFYFSTDEDEALSMARKALELDPTRADAGSVLYEVLTNDGEIDKAQQELEGFAEAHSDLSWPWTELSRLHEDWKEDTDNALHCAREALKRSPWDTESQYRVEELLVMTSRWEELADHLTVVSQYQRDLWDQARVLERLADVWKDKLDEKQRATNVLAEATRLDDLYFIDTDEQDGEEDPALNSLLGKELDDTHPAPDDAGEKAPQPFLTGCLVFAVLGCLAIIAVLLFR